MDWLKWPFDNPHKGMDHNSRLLQNIWYTSLSNEGNGTHYFEDIRQYSFDIDNYINGLSRTKYIGVSLPVEFPKDHITVGFFITSPSYIGSFSM